MGERSASWVVVISQQTNTRRDWIFVGNGSPFNCHELKNLSQNLWISNIISYKCVPLYRADCVLLTRRHRNIIGKSDLCMQIIGLKQKSLQISGIMENYSNFLGMKTTQSRFWAVFICKGYLKQQDGIKYG